MAYKPRRSTSKRNVLKYVCNIHSRAEYQHLNVMCLNMYVIFIQELNITSYEQGQDMAKVR